MIGRGVRIGGLVRCRRIEPRHWCGDQLLGTRNVGLAAGAGEQPVVADAMKPLRQNLEQKALMNSSALSVIVRYRAFPSRP